MTITTKLARSKSKSLPPDENLENQEPVRNFRSCPTRNHRVRILIDEILHRPFFVLIFQPRHAPSPDATDEKSVRVLFELLCHPSRHRPPEWKLSSLLLSSPPFFSLDISAPFRLLQLAAAPARRGGRIGPALSAAGRLLRPLFDYGPYTQRRPRKPPGFPTAVSVSDQLLGRPCKARYLLIAIIRVIRGTCYLHRSHPILLVVVLVLILVLVLKLLLLLLLPNI